MPKIIAACAEAPGVIKAQFVVIQNSRQNRYGLIPIDTPIEASVGIKTMTKIKLCANFVAAQKIAMQTNINATGDKDWKIGINMETNVAMIPVSDDSIAAENNTVRYGSEYVDQFVAVCSDDVNYKRRT